MTATSADKNPKIDRTKWLTMGCVLLAVAIAGLAICMVFPIRWDGLGILGAGALFYPLHLMLFTLLALVLGMVAIRRRAHLAKWTSAFTCFLSLAMALIPTGLIWREATVYHVPLSLSEYLVNAARANTGEPQPSKTVIYGVTKDGTKLELDVWSTSRPKTGPLRPAMVMIHGGGWCHGNRSMTPDWNSWLNGLGYEVFDVEYRMAPPVRWLDEIGDVKSALGWLATHAKEYHVDPTRISLMGCSAGANLALLAAYSTGNADLPPSTDVIAPSVRCEINIYGPTDLALMYHTCPSRSYIQSLLKAYIGGSPEEFPDRYRLLSPLTHVSPKAPPTLTVIGTCDRIVTLDQATLLDAALSKAGVPHEMCLLPGNDHSFDSNWGGFGTQIARAKIEAFLKSH